MKIVKRIISLLKPKKEVNASKTMSTYERTINRMKRRIYAYQNTCVEQKAALRKTNEFINKLRDEGRVTKDEIEIYFKK